MHEWRYQQCVNRLFRQQCTIRCFVLKPRHLIKKEFNHCLHTLLTYASPRRDWQILPMHASSAVNPIPFATTLTHHASKESGDRTSEISYRMNTTPHTPGFSLPPQISLRLTADRTLPSSEQGTRSCTDAFLRSMLQLYLPAPLMHAHSILSSVFLPALEGASRPTLVTSDLTALSLRCHCAEC